MCACVCACVRVMMRLSVYVSDCVSVRVIVSVRGVCVCASVLVCVCVRAGPLYATFTAQLVHMRLQCYFLAVAYGPQIDVSINLTHALPLAWHLFDFLISLLGVLFELIPSYGYTLLRVYFHSFFSFPMEN